MAFDTLIRVISLTGYKPGLPEYEAKRMIIFNRLNFCAFCISIIRVLFIAFFTPSRFSHTTAAINLLPAIFFVLMALLVYYRLFRLATICEFLVAPPLFTLVCSHTGEAGLDMYVVLYMLFGFFYLNRVFNVLFAFTYCLVFFGYMHFGIEQHDFRFSLTSPVSVLSFFNYLAAFFMIFITMYFIKYNVWKYERSLREQQQQLQQQNAEITAQRDEMSRQAARLREKTSQLMELNHVKTKLFSIISHDLRTSVYSVKNIFDAVGKGYISEPEMLAMIPQASSEINNSIELVNNLLGWARNQFNEIKVNPRQLDLAKLTDAAFRLFARQAEKKQIRLESRISVYVFAFADNDMISTVLRNLVSNAVKFTRPGGTVTVRTEPDGNFIRLIVSDDGVGMPEEAIRQVFNNEYYTTMGTAGETGTGLGLMICRDFVQLNRGRLDVKSTEGGGTTFIITLPYNQAAAQG